MAKVELTIVFAVEKDAKELAQEANKLFKQRGGISLIEMFDTFKPVEKTFVVTECRFPRNPAYDSPHAEDLGIQPFGIEIRFIAD